MGSGCCHVGIVLPIIAAAGLFSGGCGGNGDRAQAGHQEPTRVASNGTAHDHSDWWCAEHGVPEEICAQCNAKLVAQFKKKGDWCKEHDRPDSQCFIHHPELKEKFAAQYRARYGKEPPPIEEESTKEEVKKRGSL